MKKEDAVLIKEKKDNIKKISNNDIEKVYDAVDKICEDESNNAFFAALFDERVEAKDSKGHLIPSFPTVEDLVKNVLPVQKKSLNSIFEKNKKEMLSQKEDIQISDKTIQFVPYLIWILQTSTNKDSDGNHIHEKIIKSQKFKDFKALALKIIDKSIK